MKSAGLGSRQLVEPDLVERDRERNLPAEAINAPKLTWPSVSDLREDRAGGDVESVDEQHGNPSRTRSSTVSSGCGLPSVP